MEINFASGQTYTPGVAQTFTIVITDPVARVYGFQLTARLESNLANGQAGDFTAGPQQLVLCDDGDVKRDGVCRANAPIQFIEHSDPFRTNTIYRILDAAGDERRQRPPLHRGQRRERRRQQHGRSHLYRRLPADSRQTARGARRSRRAASAGDFNPNAGLASGTWLEIKGTDLSTTTRSWEGGDFNGAKAPTSLDGVSVTINGLPGYVSYISPTQVNVQAPDDPTVGPGIQIQVSNAGGKSNVITLPKAAIAPALLGHPAFKVGGTQYVVAQVADQTFVGEPDSLQG